MTSSVLRRSLLVGMCLGLFVVGFLCGSVSQRRADAQLPGIGQGALGSVTELGSSIVECRDAAARQRAAKKPRYPEKDPRRPRRREVTRACGHPYPDTDLLRRVSRGSPGRSYADVAPPVTVGARVHRRACRSAPRRGGPR
jgi:hypothetical protein